jgi:histidinol-phosphate aminotransferase
MGMAGLRIGYLLAHPDLAAQISKAKLPYSVNQFSLTAAEVALDHPDRFRAAIRSILAERERLEKELKSIPGITLYPSQANFFLLSLPVSPHTVFDQLFNEGVLVRDVSSYPMLSQCLRVSIGTREENDRFLQAFRCCMTGQSPVLNNGAPP